MTKAFSSTLTTLEQHPSGVARFISSTPQTREICNDPFLVGVRYTNALRDAVSSALIALKAKPIFSSLNEQHTIVLHILRGGLNFGIREALASAYGWNNHGSAFVSAQRAKKGGGSEEWYISENTYEKIYVPHEVSFIFGDVVATGTSLLFGLQELIKVTKTQKASVRSIIFFTIGSYIAEEILAKIDSVCRDTFPNYQGSAVVYFEGRFDVASPQSKLSIKEDGTDLLRSPAILAQEFVESQYDNPAYPIERCTIYDAGSRAFYLPEYFHDLKDYWQKTLSFAESGMTYDALLKERFPELDPKRFGEVDLKTLCQTILSKLSQVEA